MDPADDLYTSEFYQKFTKGSANEPKYIGSTRLNTLLEENGMLEKNRKEYIPFLSKSEQLIHMNIAVLSSVILFMYRNGNVINRKEVNFATISPQVEHFLPIQEKDIKTKEQRNEYEILQLQMSATFLRYIFFVKNAMVA